MAFNSSESLLKQMFNSYNEFTHVATKYFKNTSQSENLAKATEIVQRYNTEIEYAKEVQFVRLTMLVR